MKSVGELGRFGPISMLTYGTIKHVEDNNSPYKRFNVFEKKYSKESTAFLNDEGVLKGISYMDTIKYDNYDDEHLAQHIKQYMYKKQYYYEHGKEVI